MKQKVIWLVNQYAVPVQKRTRQIVLSQHLEKQGYKVYIICGSKIHGVDDNFIKDKHAYKKVEFDGARFIVIRISDYSRQIKRVYVSVQFQRRIWKLRNQLPKPDVIVSDFAGLFGNIFLKWKKKYGTRIIYDILDLWPEDFLDVGFLKKNSITAKLLFNMEHRAYREADNLIFSMDGGRDYVKEKRWDIESGGDIDLNKIGALNNGVDLETVDRNREKFVIQDIDLESKKFKAVYLGSIRRANNVDLIVEAARILQQQEIANISILIYGDGDYRESLENKAMGLKLSNIKFKGRLDVEYAPYVLACCDLNLFNFMNAPICRFGLSPNKLFMYFASGKPVLSMVRPKYELVESRKCGIVTDNSPQAVAEGIVWFSQMDKTEYEKYCKNCRLVAEEYDYKNLVGILIDQIEGKFS
ncbi:MAG: glycosyltransferase family 4 protein [Lachnospiraceae bacterium]|nr:glycosyltransferase family 4 protein [Lachnospiraceae bacterium]